MTALTIASTVAEAVNLVPDPTVESGIFQAQIAAGATLYTVTYDTGRFDSGTRSLLSTRTTTSPSVNVAVIDLTPTAASNLVVLHVTPGQVLSGSFRVWCAITGFRARCSFQWRDAANINLATDTGPLVLSLPLSQWNTVAIEGITAPANADHLVIVGSVLLPAGGVTVGGEQAWYDSLMINEGATVEPFFYGESLGCQWDGTAHQSSSTRLSQPFQRWNGSALESLTLDGEWDGSTIQPLSLDTVEITA